MRSRLKSWISKRLSERNAWRERRRRSHSMTNLQAAATDAPGRVNMESAAANSIFDPNAKALDKDRLCTITLSCCDESCAVVIHFQAQPPWAKIRDDGC